jgi:hypothetical protein
MIRRDIVARGHGGHSLGWGYNIYYGKCRYYGK